MDLPRPPQRPVPRMPARSVPPLAARMFVGLMLAGAVAPIALADVSHWICLDGNYLNSSCWDEGIPSDPGEVGVIDEENFGNRYTVTFDGDGGAGTISLAVPEARWFMQNSSFSPAFSFNVVPGAEVEMISSSFDGQTGVYTNGGTLIVKRSCLLDLAGFEQNNLLRIVATGVGGDATLTVSPSFTNHGVMEFQGGCCAGNNAILIVPGSEVLTNTGGINLLAGPGNHFIDAHLDNQGVINLGKTSFFSKVNGQYSNSNSISFGESVVLNVDNGSTLTQSAGLIDMPPSSYIDVDTGGAFTFDGGTLDGQVRLTSADLSLAPPSIGGAFEFRSASNTLTGDIGSDQSVRLLATGSNGQSATVTSTGDVTNAGTVQFAAGCCNGTNTTLIIPDGSLFTNTGLLDLSAANGTQTITADFDNQGTVIVGGTVAFNKPDGLYRNNGDITIAEPGSISLTGNASFSQDGGTLDLQDARNVSLAAGSTFFFNDGGIPGTGEVVLTDANLVIDAGAAGQGRFRFRGANNTLTGTVGADQTVTLFATGSNGQNAAVTTTGDVTNLGTVKFSAGCCNGINTTLIVPDGSTFTNMGFLDLRAANGTQTITADFDNQGTIVVSQPVVFNKPAGLYRNSGDITVTSPGSPGSIGLKSGASFSQDGGTLILEDDDFVVLDPGSTFFFNGGDISGAGAVLLTGANLVIDPNSTGQGRFRFFRSNNTLTGDIAPDQALTLQATGIAGQSVEVTTTGDVFNAGSITLDGGCCSGNNATLIVPDGSLLTNVGSLVLQGTDGVRRLTADLDNQGTMMIDRISSLNKPNGVYLNQGTLKIQPGDKLIAAGSTFTNAGPAIISGRGTLDVSGISFSNEAVVAPGDPLGTLTVTGTYNQAATGTLSIEVAGVNPGAEHDRLAVNGAGVVNLDGDLHVSLLGGFRPQSSDTFTIVTGSTINGSFANAPADPNGLGTVDFAGGRFTVTYNANAVVLSNFTRRPIASEQAPSGITPAGMQPAQP